MQDLADAGADSAGGGGLDRLYGVGGDIAGEAQNTDGLPAFFQTGGGSGNPMALSPTGGDGIGGGGESGALEPLANFGNGEGTDALLASLGLPAGLEGTGAGGVGSSGGGGGADRSEWALMQKQFEDMNKSFLQE